MLASAVVDEALVDVVTALVIALVLREADVAVASVAAFHVDAQLWLKSITNVNDHCSKKLVRFFQCKTIKLLGTLKTDSDVTCWQPPLSPSEHSSVS